MQADLPHTLYNRRKTKKKKGGSASKSFRYNANDPAIKKQMEFNRKRKERLEAEGKKVEYTIDELFNR